MNSTHFTIKSLVGALALLVSDSCLAAVAGNITKDGISISTEVTPEPSGRTLVHCSLINNSPYLLASVFPHSPSKAFLISLLDAAGKPMVMEPKWARLNAQPNGINESDISRMSLLGGSTAPGDGFQFQFYLEEAYGNIVKSGRTLEVKWNNIYAPPNGTLTVDEYKDRDGKIIPKYEEPNHFPGLQVFSVSLTLPGHEGEVPPIQQEVKPPVPQQPELSPAGSPDRELKRPVAKPAEATQNETWRWWWLVFLLPVFLVGWLIIRRPNNS